MNEILFLEPCFSHKLWGGSRIREDFNMDVSGDDIGECWGIAAHKNGDCTIKNGVHKGQKLSEVWNTNRELFGNINGDTFPLLIKIIDAREDLSIQVHPDDNYASLNENNALGKTECWYVLDCPKDASLVIGHNAKSREELTSMIHERLWDSLINKLPVKPGDFIQINPGTIHAITSGMLILETQQNSDVTYRVYDYDRTLNGQKRELHIEKSIDVIKVPDRFDSESIIKTSKVSDCDSVPFIKLFNCDKYTVYKVQLLGQSKHCEFVQNKPFMNMTVISGSGEINGNNITKGDSFIIPADYGNVEINGELEIICSSIN